jgi:hypothetical protein
MTPQIWVYLSIFAANLIIMIAVGYFGYVRKTEVRLVKLEAVGDLNPILTEIRNRLTELEMTNKVFWKVMDPALAKIIHSPVHVERDALVDKMVAGCITKEELLELDMRLGAMLEEETGDIKFAGMLMRVRVQTAIALENYREANGKTELATSELNKARKAEATWYRSS